MSTRLFALLIGSALMVPQAATAGEGGWSATGSDKLPIPPIPYAETIPWLAHTAQPKIQLPPLSLLLKPATLNFAGIALEPASTNGMLRYTLASQATPNAWSE